MKNQYSGTVTRKYVADGEFCIEVRLDDPGETVLGLAIPEEPWQKVQNGDVLPLSFTDPKTFN